MPPKRWSGLGHTLVAVVGAFFGSRNLRSLKTLHRPGRGGADLTRVEGPHAGQRGDGGGQVGVLEDQAGALAAQLHQQPLHGAGPRLVDAPADRGAGGEADHVHVGGVGEGGRNDEQWTRMRLDETGNRQRSGRPREPGDAEADLSRGEGFRQLVERGPLTQNHERIHGTTPAEPRARSLEMSYRTPLAR